MKELTEEMERDIKDYLDKIDNMNENDKRDALRLLFVKHLHLENSEFLLGKYEFNCIISNAKTNFVNQSTHVTVEGKDIQQEHKRIICIAQAVIGELRKLKVLHKVVKFKK